MGEERALARWFSSSEIIIFNLDSDQWAVDDGDVVGVEHGRGVRRRVEEQPAAGPGQAQVLLVISFAIIIIIVIKILVVRHYIT